MTGKLKLGLGLGGGIQRANDLGLPTYIEMPGSASSCTQMEF
jgi:hypothetical protein